MGHNGVPVSLADQAGLRVLDTLYLKANRIESDYMSWVHSLSVLNYQVAESLDISDFNAADVLVKYRIQNSPRPKKRRKRAAGQGKDAGRRRGNDRLVRGIPVNSDPGEYIKYRKCLYVNTVNQWRSQLISALSAPAMEHLLDLLTNIYRRNMVVDEKGIFTLQIVLVTEFTSTFLINSLAFNRYFDRYSSNVAVENRIGPTLLRNCLIDARSLNSLALERVCSDQLLELIGKVAVNIKYLNISQSYVSDKGLLDLVGVRVDSGGSRPRLSRACKTITSAKGALVKNQFPSWSRESGQGAVKLQHVEAKSLKSVSWHLSDVYKYNDYQHVPIDAGFVGLLRFLPHLKVLKTEVGGRAVLAYSRHLKQSRRKTAACPLELEVLTETHPTSAILEAVSEMCPRLKDLQVDWHQYYTPHNSGREDWLPLLNKLQNLSHLRTSDIDYKTSNLRDTLPVIGANLVNLHLQEIWSFRYSLTKQVKESCPNLEKYCVFMTSSNLLATTSKILVERDVDLRLESSSSSRGHFSKLKELHLIGPLESGYVRYVVHGANKLKSLTLGIEWPDSTFCNVIPTQSKDMLGREFLDEVRSVNSLALVEELHLFTQYRRGGCKLDADLAFHIAQELKNLRHLGTFKFWNIPELLLEDVMTEIRRLNPAITFDEDYPRQPARGNRFLDLHVEDRGRVACSWLPLNFRASSIFHTMTELMEGPGHWGDVDDMDESDDDDSLNYSDDDNDDGGMGMFALDEYCVIM